MRFSTVFSVLACGAMALAAAVSPDALAKRGVDISVVIDGLNDKCDSILPRFDTCESKECTSGLVLEVVAAVKVATNDCVGLETDLAVEVLAEAVATVISKITVKLNDHKSSCNEECGDYSVYADVDVCITALLKQLDLCVSGIIAAVTNLLGDVVAILKGLSLTLVLKICLII